MIPPWADSLEEDPMLNDMFDIEELCTADSVGEANRLLSEGWELLGFHPAPPSANGAFGTSTTIFVMARMYDYDDEEADFELEELEQLEPLHS